MRKFPLCVLIGLSLAAEAFGDAGAERPLTDTGGSFVVELSDSDNVDTGSDDLDVEQLKVKVERLRAELAAETNRSSAAEAEKAEEEARLKQVQDRVADMRANLSEVRAKVKEATQQADEAKAHLKALQNSDVDKVGPVGAWVSALPHQEALAWLVGILGLLSVFGPSTYTRFFLSVSGSAVGGLMVGACFGFFVGAASNGGPTWLDCVEALVKGDGELVGYVMWAIMMALGTSRWLFGFNCGPYASVDAREATVSGMDTLRRPLLHVEEPRHGRAVSLPGGQAG